MQSFCHWQTMVLAFVFILVGLWLLGIVGTYPIGASVDLLLVTALLLLVIEWRRDVLRGRLPS